MPAPQKPRTPLKTIGQTVPSPNPQSKLTVEVAQTLDASATPEGYEKIFQPYFLELGYNVTESKTAERRAADGSGKMVGGTMHYTGGGGKGLFCYGKSVLFGFPANDHSKNSEFGANGVRLGLLDAFNLKSLGGVTAVTIMASETTMNYMPTPTKFHVHDFMKEEVVYENYKGACTHIIKNVKGMATWAGSVLLHLEEALIKGTPVTLEMQVQFLEILFFFSADDDKRNRIPMKIKTIINIGKFDVLFPFPVATAMLLLKKWGWDTAALFALGMKHENDINDLKKGINDLKNDIDGLKNDTTTLQRRANDNDEKEKEKEKEKAELESALTTASDEIQVLKSGHGEIKGEIVEIKTVVTIIQTVQNFTVSHLTGLTGYVANLYKRQDKLESSLFVIIVVLLYVPTLMKMMVEAGMAKVRKETAEESTKKFNFMMRLWHKNKLESINAKNWMLRKTVAVEDKVNTLQGEVTTLQGDVSAVQGDVTTMQGDLANHVATTDKRVTNLADKVIKRVTNLADKVIKRVNNLGGEVRGEIAAEVTNRLASEAEMKSGIAADKKVRIDNGNYLYRKQRDQEMSLEELTSTVLENDQKNSESVANLKKDVEAGQAKTNQHLATVEADVEATKGNVSNLEGNVVNLSVSTAEKFSQIMEQD